MKAPQRCAAFLVAAIPAAAMAAEPTATAVEFYNTSLRHYFLTADPAEIRSIESGGAGAGWVRTGGEFGVFRAAPDAPGAVPVCRFYGTPGRGPNSHFYTSDAVECEAVKRDAGWTYEGVGFHILRPDAGRCAQGTTPVYRSYNNGHARNDANHRFTVDATVFAKSASFGYVAEGVAMCAPLSEADRYRDAVRLLRQATFGATPAEAARAAAMGPAAWVEEQLGARPSPYPEYPWVPSNRAQTCVDDRTPPLRADSYCARDNYTLFALQLEFFRKSLARPDALRGRVAFALSQILVTSGLDNSRNYAMRHYQQLLEDHAFGNYHDLLLAVTLSPVMGDYLDMANNNKASATARTEPNENYAREVLQLFSIGTWQLNPDGTRRLDASGKPVSSYDQDVIEGFARVFTGWTYPAVPGTASRNNNPRNYTGPMVAVDANHDFGSKRLLDGAAAPANLGMRQDLEGAHRNIFNHANVGPFIGRQLIQKLVTSDPTPAYVERVSRVFADNGAGVRGDLKAVVRAILLDPEARGARKIDAGYGKLLEPTLLVTATARAAGARSDGVYLRTQSSTLGQNVFYAPSVFNFYSPSFVLPASTRVGPEFQLLTTASSIARANFANSMLFATTIAPDTTVYGATGTQLDFSHYAAVAGDTEALLSRIERDVIAAPLPAGVRSAFAAAINALPASDLDGRARTALYLAVASPHFQVQR